MTESTHRIRWLQEILIDDCGGCIGDQKIAEGREKGQGSIFSSVAFDIKRKIVAPLRVYVLGPGLVGRIVNREVTTT